MRTYRGWFQVTTQKVEHIPAHSQIHNNYIECTEPNQNISSPSILDLPELARLSHRNTNYLVWLPKTIENRLNTQCSGSHFLEKLNNKNIHLLATSISFYLPELPIRGYGELTREHNSQTLNIFRTRRRG